METRAPTAGRIAIALGFALSCFGLLLFLWLAFGGPIPLKPESYRFSVPFQEATQLAQESDVRISGVSVGKVKSIELAEPDDKSVIDRVRIVMEISSGITLGEESEAEIKLKTILGQKFVDVVPKGGEPYVRDALLRLTPDEPARDADGVPVHGI